MKMKTGFRILLTNKIWKSLTKEEQLATLQHAHDKAMKHNKKPA